MSDERDELLREIGAALTIEPSPSFAAGVRERLAAEPPSLWARRGLWWSVAGAAACAATIAAMVVANRSPVTPVEVVSDAAVVATSDVAPTPIVASRPAAATPVGETRASRRPARTPQIVRVVTEGQSRLEVLVSPDEANALRRLLLATRSGRAQAAPGPMTTDAETGDLLPLEAIVISPIEPTTQGGREREGGGRE